MFGSTLEPFSSVGSTISDSYFGADEIGAGSRTGSQLDSASSKSKPGSRIYGSSLDVFESSKPAAESAIGSSTGSQLYGSTFDNTYASASDIINSRTGSKIDSRIDGSRTGSKLSSRAIPVGSDAIGMKVYLNYFY